MPSWAIRAFGAPERGEDDEDEEKEMQRLCENGELLGNMRIAFFTEAYEPFVNGVVVLIKAFRESLQQRGHEVVIFAPRYPGYTDREEGVVRLPSIAWSRVGYPFLRPFTGTYRAFRRFGFDLIHTHHPFTTGLLAERLARRFRLPVVYTFHTLLPDYAHYVPLPRCLTRPLLLHIVRRHCARVQCVTVTTHLMRTWLREHGVNTPIQVVSPVVALPPASPNARQKIRASLGIPMDAPVLVYAGRLAPEKQVDFLLRAVVSICPRFNFFLLLVGSGPSEKALRHLVAVLGLTERVRFAGAVPHEQMSDYYAASDLFVFPSTSDTLGLVLLEAMSVGLPCVAVAVHGPAEVVNDGVTGFLTPFNEAAFGQAIARLLADERLRHKMGAAAVECARQHRDRDMGEQLLAAYEAARAALFRNGVKEPVGS